MNATNPADILAALIRCPSVTPADGGALDVLAQIAGPLGFEVHRITFSDTGTPDVDNLYARAGDRGPHLMFAGHTDVVPPGEEAAWLEGPFSAAVRDGMMYGRGAIDMKGGIACFIAAYARFTQAHGNPDGSVSLLITGDEEGPSVNGTEKLLAWAANRGEAWDAAIVGEPTNPDRMGDMIKVGRRGSLSGDIVVEGVQGHVAYPHIADNPLRGLTALAAALLDPPLDGGSERFPPSNLEITSIDTGNAAVNVIPARARLTFNIRFSDRWTADTLAAEIRGRLSAAASAGAFRPGRDPVRYDVVFRDRPSESFLTHDTALIRSLGAAVESVTGRTPVLSTTGGTSDARFVKDYCPVVEFGLVGKTMHMVDERVSLDDLESLTRIYERFLSDWFAKGGAQA